MTSFITILLLITINIFTVYKLLFNLIFSDMDDFKESIKFTVTPDIFSLFRGEYVKDRIGEMKFGLFVILCVAITAIEYNVVSELILRIVN